MKARSSRWQRPAFAMLAAHAAASCRDGNSSTVKPPLSGGRPRVAARGEGAVGRDGRKRHGFIRPEFEDLGSVLT